MIKNRYRIIGIGFAIFLGATTMSFAQKRLTTALKANVGFSGFEKKTLSEYRMSISTDKVKPLNSFSFGFENSIYVNKKRNISFSIEYLYGFSAFEKLHIYEAYNSITEKIVSEHVESLKINKHSLLFPIKLNFEYKKFLLGAGIVNHLNLLANSNYVYTIEDLELNEKGVVWEDKVKASKAKKSFELGSVYLDRKLEFQYVINLGFSISPKYKIGIEYMDYLTENNINHIFWSEDIVQHNIYSINKNMASIYFTLII